MRTLTELLTITKNGRGRLVLVSAEEFFRLKSRDRRAVQPAELSDAELDLIAKAGMPVECAALDAEMKGYAL
ncbi:hypothetical protein [Acidithiobacillus ferrooxidans]|uniref:hypothetical protein n=1 Tax=Acidithiobacillus ferrooxidans TaxID=920 RepID=UPI001C06CD22|nr:hypothetical protein [Acidithiobacillus ferrooxidans]